MSLKPSNYTTLSPFKAWVQQALPAVYDDSLSYTDLLSKMLKYINDLVSNNNNLITDMTSTIDYINNYFNDLNVQDNIDKKLDEMVEDGTLDSIIGPYITLYLTPEMFGAKGDETTDDTEAFKKVIAKAIETRKDIVLSNKVYKTTEPLELTKKIVMRGQSYADEYYGQAEIRNTTTDMFSCNAGTLEVGTKFLNLRFFGDESKDIHLISNTNIQNSQIMHCGISHYSTVFNNCSFNGAWLQHLYIDEIYSIGVLSGSDNVFSEWYINGYKATTSSDSTLLPIKGLSLTRLKDIYATGVERGTNYYGCTNVLTIADYCHNLVFDSCWLEYANKNCIYIQGGNDELGFANNITFNQCCIRGGGLRIKGSYVTLKNCSCVTFNNCYFNKHHAGYNSIDGTTLFDIGQYVYSAFENMCYDMTELNTLDTYNNLAIYSLGNLTNKKKIGKNIGINGTGDLLVVQNNYFYCYKQDITTGSNGEFTLSDTHSVDYFVNVISSENLIVNINNKTETSTQFILREQATGTPKPNFTTKILVLSFHRDNPVW